MYSHRAPETGGRVVVAGVVVWSARKPVAVLKSAVLFRSASKPLAVLLKLPVVLSQS